CAASPLPTATAKSPYPPHPSPPRWPTKKAPALLDNRPRPPGAICAVFFDGGLTLIHSQPPLAERYIAALSRRGITATAEAVQAALRHAGDLMLTASRADPDLWAADAKVQKHWNNFYVNAFQELGTGDAATTCAEALYAEYNRPGTWQLF